MSTFPKGWDDFFTYLFIGVSRKCIKCNSDDKACPHLACSEWWILGQLARVSKGFFHLSKTAQLEKK